jgi:parallel beta-helix repeat protein
LSGNAQDGLLLSNANNNVVLQNTVDANGANGIELATLGSGNTIDHNTALGNGRSGTGGVDILDQNNIFCTKKNSFNSSSPVCMM